ncbi:MAG: bifunctional tetrahydrofolate synthase/dihydrofolate synthase [Bermanella sp.]
MKEKNLTQWLQYLESLHPSEIDMGLARVRDVAQKMNLLKPANTVVMAAGTNGKGTTVTLTSSILQQAGLKVGTFMSPHLHQYNERVKVNGVMLGDEDFIESFEVIDKSRGDVLLTYFEVGTLSALYLFIKYQVDVAVLEVGLGGRLDAVNIIDADISVVTSIGLDHQDWLGDDLNQIAFEKAGIYRSGKPAICGERTPQSSLINHAENIGSPLYVKGRAFDFEQNKYDWCWTGLSDEGQCIKFENLPLPSLPIENAATVLQLLQFMPKKPSIVNIHKGILAANLSGRLERVTQPFKAVLDVGHNPQAAQLLAKNLESQPVKGRRFALLAMLEDKDPAGVVEKLAPYIDGWNLAGLKGYRGQKVETLKAKVIDTVNACICYEGVEEALDDLLLKMNEDDELVIVGSFMVIAKAHDWLALH